MQAQDFGAGFGERLQAASGSIRIVRDALILVAIAVAGFFLWGQVLPYVWPAGPAALVAPGFWTFMGVSVIARAIWNILFLCPKVR